MKNKQSDKIKILEHKLEALADYLKVEVVAEKDDEGWINTYIVRYKDMAKKFRRLGRF